jgi:hypothetical protein
MFVKRMISSIKWMKKSTILINFLRKNKTISMRILKCKRSYKGIGLLYKTKNQSLKDLSSCSTGRRKKEQVVFKVEWKKLLIKVKLTKTKIIRQ